MTVTAHIKVTGISAAKLYAEAPDFIWRRADQKQQQRVGGIWGDRQAGQGQLIFREQSESLFVWVTSEIQLEWLSYVDNLLGEWILRPWWQKKKKKKRILNS